MRGLGERLQAYLDGDGGGREVLAISYPLILSQMSFTVQVFIDRLFLTWYSPDAVAGAVTALFATWSLIGLCLGVGEYVTTFVAQYLGAGRDARIGPAVWQGVYFALAAGIVIAALSPLARPVFAWSGHAPGVMAQEIPYARLLMLGSFPVVLMATLASFFAGRGETRVVLVVNVLSTVLNAVLDWFLIFGRAGASLAGVRGAAFATISAQSFGALCYAALMLRRSSRERYSTLAGWRFDPALFGRLIRYGLPAGLQYSLEIGAFALFMMIVGRIGAAELAASGIAFNLNMIVFMPMLGLGVGVSSLVGRYLGGGRPDVAERATRTAVGMALAYMLLCGVVYVGAPRLLLAPYAAGADPKLFGPVEAITIVLLRFVALYSIFDMLNVVYAAGIKGAGDTTYPMLVTVVLSWFTMLGPAYYACMIRGSGVYVAWTFASAYVVFLGIAMMQRFKAGAWKSLRVIEPHVPELDGAEPAAEVA
jgi:multidrug resistance protein, MATE family